MKRQASTGLAMCIVYQCQHRRDSLKSLGTIQPYSVQGCGTQVFDYCTEISLGGDTTRARPIWMDSTPLPSLNDPLTPPKRPPSSRPSSGRMSGLRGQLLSQRESEPPSLFRSSSSSHLPTCFDDHPPRLKTAVSVFQLCLDFRHL